MEVPSDRAVSHNEKISLFLEQCNVFPLYKYSSWTDIKITMLTGFSMFPFRSITILTIIITGA